MENVRQPQWIGWPLHLAGDKWYSEHSIWNWFEHRVIEQVFILQGSDQKRRKDKRHLNRRLYKRRARVEQCVGLL